ncbi:glycoside hydrolase family 3 protein [Luteimicrobium xylanilyticum]|uniref:Exo-alpha-(1->6)-L-arabinopyranosidase n=1 Tax=Luteimicrobium xylanilyticum TaxID=1133546 RepID=A0A5P9Q7N1_9MICO|nr:glycoside hydrolase family 3 protein [Luteimicrobium xylanilyticum]QFU97444.1 Beta-glucosidase [Luteimicrobium xylanilyticum]
MRTRTTAHRWALRGLVGATAFALVGLTPVADAATRTLTGVPTASDDASPTRAELDAMPFRNPKLSLDVRTKDLLSRLTQDEEISLLHQFPLPVPRLGIGQWRAGTEAVHGLAWTTSPDDGAVHTATATTFPQAVGLASTWDTDLIRRVGGVVGNEARGYNSEDPALWGLNLWAPVVNLLRDPRWGRNEEGYSEDPTLTGAISTAYGKGMEGDDPFYLKTAPTLKHYLAYNNETNRDTSSSVVPPRVLHEYDEQAFEPAIKNDAATGVMASYNLVNGRPATVDPSLNDVVRSWTDKPLFNVSDAAAPTNLTGSEQYYATQAEADAALIKAGLDTMTVNDNDPQPTITAVKQALTQGLLTQADVDKAASDALSIRFRLGEFDPDGGPYADITSSAIDTTANRALARTTADEAQVLLKNAKQTLPLDAKKTKRVAVVGPLADTLYTDWYGGKQPYSVTPLDGITERLGKGADVRSTEGVDRITLRDAATGKYVVGGADTKGANLAATSATAGATAQFDVFDWGDGVVTLRSAANGKTVGFNWSGFANDQDQPNGWYVQQLFKLEDRPDGNVVLRYAGYESSETWAPSHTTPYVTLDSNGMLVLGAATADQATEFSRGVVTSGTDAAVQAAKGADAAVVVVGTMPFINGREAHDRTDLGLAAGQEALVEAVRKANPNTVVVLESSYPQTIGKLQKDVPAILWTTHAGQETGHAVADVLFGDVNPAGRLTQTWPASQDTLPADLNDYDIITSGQTYLFDKALYTRSSAPLYPFGYGLSYTSFRYSHLRVADRSLSEDGTVRVSVDVTNTGRRDGDEVVQLYTHQRTSRDTTAVRQLRAFQRVHVKAGRTAHVTLRVPVQDLRHWDVTRGRWVVETSAYDVLVGSSSQDVRARSVVHVQGERIPARDLARSTEAQNYDAQHGTTLVDTSKAAGTSVEAQAAGSWVAYKDADLGRGARTLRVKVARVDVGTAHVQVRLGSPTGRVVGTADVPSTGDKYTYADVTASLRGASGRRDVYLVFDAPVRVSSFSVGR